MNYHVPNADPPPWTKGLGPMKLKGIISWWGQWGIGEAEFKKKHPRFSWKQVPFKFFWSVVMTCFLMIRVYIYRYHHHAQHVPYRNLFYKRVLATTSSLLTPIYIILLSSNLSNNSLLSKPRAKRYITHPQGEEGAAAWCWRCRNREETGPPNVSCNGW